MASADLRAGFLVDPSSQPSIAERYRARAEFGATLTIDDLWTPLDESLTDWREILHTSTL
ncbi:MAG: hypothetical protein QM323_03225 [Acidobacteriota bacterium]|nr:hypothetical protein [Acidobacteriota bacterium]